MEFRYIEANRSMRMFTPINLHSVNFDFKHLFSYSLDFIPALEEKENELILELVWNYKIIHANEEIYDYNHLTEYEITDKINAPLVEDLKHIINQSYSKMSLEFQNRPDEFKSLNEIGDLPANTISSTLYQLQKILLPLHG
ncbi:MAG: hypothetical protein Q8891_06800 [Bacteroidota bacterium]|nr:hypothetical protein [Bacteroidota bacterium]